MMGKASDMPADKLALYDRLVAAIPAVQRKGASMPYTSVNGHMFSFLTRAGKLALRLPEPQRQAFLKKHRNAVCEQHGVVLQEYVEIPDALMTRAKELQRLFQCSYAYVCSLKPKETTKKKASKKNGK